MRCKQFIFVSLAGVVLAASLAGCGGAAPASSAAASSVAASSVVVSSAAAEAALPDGVYTADFETDSIADVQQLYIAHTKAAMDLLNG